MEINHLVCISLVGMFWSQISASLTGSQIFKCKRMIIVFCDTHVFFFETSNFVVIPIFIGCEFIFIFLTNIEKDQYIE